MFFRSNCSQNPNRRQQVLLAIVVAGLLILRGVRHVDDGLIGGLVAGVVIGGAILLYRKRHGACMTTVSQSYGIRKK